MGRRFCHQQELYLNDASLPTAVIWRLSTLYSKVQDYDKSIVQEHRWAGERRYFQEANAFICLTSLCFTSLLNAVPRKFDVFKKRPARVILTLCSCAIWCGSMQL